MKANKFIDTNVFLRYLTADIPEKAIKCKSLIEALESGAEEAETSLLVIAELVGVLESYYRLTLREVGERVSYILGLKGLKIENKKMLQEALAGYVEKNVDFIDACNAAYMKHHNLDEIYSYDERDCKKLGLSRVEP